MSRPEIRIRFTFCQIPDREHQDSVLHHISPPIFDHDIFFFLEYNLRPIRPERSLDAGWPDETVIKYLGSNCTWAVHLGRNCLFVHPVKGKGLQARRLDTIL